MILRRKGIWKCIYLLVCQILNEQCVRTWVKSYMFGMYGKRFMQNGNMKIHAFTEQKVVNEQCLHTEVKPYMFVVYWKRFMEKGNMKICAFTHTSDSKWTMCAYLGEAVHVWNVWEKIYAKRQCENTCIYLSRRF